MQDLSKTGKAGFKLKVHRNYSVNFVRMVDGKPNIIVVSPEGRHQPSATDLEIFELTMKRKIYNQRLQNRNKTSAEVEETKVKLKIKDLVAVASTAWTGYRRGMIKSISEAPILFSVYLFDHGMTCISPENEVFPIPVACKSRRPAVYSLTLEHVFPTELNYVEKTIDWTERATLAVNAWLSKMPKEKNGMKNKKGDNLCMNVSFVVNSYEVVGDLIRHKVNEDGKTVQDGGTLVDFLLLNNVACGLPQFNGLLALAAKEISDSSKLPKVADKNEQRVLRPGDVDVLLSDSLASASISASTKSTTTTIPKTNMKYSLSRFDKKEDGPKSPIDLPIGIPSELERVIMAAEWGMDDDLTWNRDTLTVDECISSRSDLSSSEFDSSPTDEFASSASASESESEAEVPATSSCGYPHSRGTSVNEL